MLETAKSATSPSVTPQFLQSDMPSPTPGLERRTESSPPSDPSSSISEFITSPNDSKANQRTPSQYVPAGTPGTPTDEEDSVLSKTELPLLTTFPTEVRESVLPDLASSAGDREGMDVWSPSLGVVSAILSEDSRNESASSEFVETLATSFTKEENELNLSEPTDEDRPVVHASQSMPILMASPATIPVVGDDAGKPSVVPGLDNSQHGSTEESVHLIQNIYAGSQVLAPGENLLVFRARFSVRYLCQSTIF